ncbi:MAG: Rhodanese domain protein [Actinomycetia bacterium]|nr:Rhodanese domain protein [Actinomycetes bacterium]
MSASIEELLDDARTRLHRVDPFEAAAAMADGALVVDTRPLERRSAEGEIPGSVVIGRNVPEWRLDPRSPHHIPEVMGYGHRIIVVCNEGYASTLAAVSLQDLGFRNATDLVGGYRAWRAAGLPITFELSVPRDETEAPVALHS